MRTLVPSSRKSLRLALSPFDIIFAAITPLLALQIRDAYILSPRGATTVAIYCAISLAFSLIAFVMFRTSDGMAQYFSVRHVMSVLKAVLTAELLTFVVLFSFTRLEGIPRPTPLIHALLLAFCLIAARAINSSLVHREPTNRRAKHDAIENVLVIGMTRLSALYIELLETCCADQRRVIGVLDDRPEYVRRSIAHTSVIGPPQQLGPLIDEFEVHGIRTHRVIISDEKLLPQEAIEEIRQICARRSISVDFIPDLIGLNPIEAAGIRTRA